MNNTNNINLVELLKNCPTGTEFYSPTYGEVIFIRIKDKIYNLPLLFKVKNSETAYFSCTKWGYENIQCMEYGGEPTVLPSKENRDWGTFKPTWDVPEDEHKQFKPFDKVLVVRKNSEYDWVWTPFLYSYFDEENNTHLLIGDEDCGLGVQNCDIIPFEGNEDLAGKKVGTKKICKIA